MVVEAAKLRKKQGTPSAATLAAQNRPHEALNAANGHSMTISTGGSMAPPPG
jgi:hypothetical protein